MLTLGQAAKEVGKTKTALANAIKAGRLSATRLEGGQYQIDPAELFRVYQKVDSSVGTETLQDKTPVDTSNLQSENAFLRENINLLLSERDDLRRRLDEEAAERRKLTAILTYKPEPKPEVVIQSEPTKSESKLWQKLFGKIKT
jgi:hypothetical protein